MTDKRDRSSNYTYDDIDLLISLVEDDLSIIECKRTDTITNKAKDAEWDKLASYFNLEASEARTAKMLRKKWDSLKKSSRKEMALAKQPQTDTGVGPSSEVRKSPWTDLIIRLMDTGSTKSFDSDTDMSTLKKRERTRNFTDAEKICLLQVVEKYLPIIENKKTGTMANQQKQMCWQNIESEFNLCSTSGSRAQHHLKSFYENYKKRLRKEELDNTPQTLIPELDEEEIRFISKLKYYKELNGTPRYDSAVEFYSVRLNEEIEELKTPINLINIEQTNITKEDPLDLDVLEIEAPPIKLNKESQCAQILVDKEVNTTEDLEIDYDRELLRLKVKQMEAEERRAAELHEIEVKRRKTFLSTERQIMLKKKWESRSALLSLKMRRRRWARLHKTN